MGLVQWLCRRIERIEKQSYKNVLVFVINLYQNHNGENMKQVTFIAKDGKKIICSLWDSVKSPKGIVQLVHGMNEHVRRYDRFANFLNKHGYIVFGDDHRAHGRTASSISNIGTTDGEQDLFSASLTDELEISDFLHKKYNLPLFVFAHSYGSFIGQAMLEHNVNAKAVCLSGTAKFSRTFLWFSKIVSWLGCKIFGKDSDAVIIEIFSPIRNTNSLSRDKNEVAKYKKDSFVRKHFSYGFYHSLFSNKLKLIGKANANTPIMIVVGAKDPVSDNAKLAKRLFQIYKKQGVKKLRINIYPEARHELLNELNYQEVQNDVLNFFDSVL